MKFSGWQRRMMEFLAKNGGTPLAKMPAEFRKQKYEKLRNQLRGLSTRGWVEGEETSPGAAKLWAITPAGYTELLVARDK